MKSRRVRSHVRGDAIATARTNPDHMRQVAPTVANDPADRRPNETHDEWFERFIAEHWAG